MNNAKNRFTVILVAVLTGFACGQRQTRTLEERPPPGQQTITQHTHGNWRVEPGDPSISFWKDQVTYPYEIKYAKAQDGHGTVWEVGYMDEYIGFQEDPAVLVLIHGKGVFGGSFGHVMKVALQRGLRVIVPDLPHYGKSLPGNLENPLERSLEDTRVAIHDLIVNQLGVKKAAYLGHSLGGQWVLGYALKYPERVEKILLEAPAGLEEFHTNIEVFRTEVPFFEPSYANHFEMWQLVWGYLVRSELAATEDRIRNFYYFKKRNPLTGAIESSRIGYFRRDSDYARFITEVRVNMITGNDQEYGAYCTTYIRDIYTMGVEIRKEDPKSLFKKLKEISVPVFIAYGTAEPFIPATMVSGNTDLKRDIIDPIRKTFALSGNPPVVKMYEGAGHFIHTDFPDEFSNDIVNFTLGYERLRQ